MYLKRRENRSLRSSLPPSEFCFLSHVLGDVAPFLRCAENLAQSTIEMVHSLL